MNISIHRKMCFLRAACVLAALTISASAHAADITYETRALTGTDGPLGPGLGAGLNFTGLTPPMLNGAGQTAFRGTLNGPVPNRAGIWSEGGGSGLALVARSGNPAPGTDVGVNFSSFGSFVLNAAGQTAFNGVLTGPGVAGGVNNTGLWSEGGGSGLALVARKGSQAPGTDPGVNFNDVGECLLNGAGQSALRGTLTGAGVTGANNSGIWSQGGGSGLALMTRAGSQAPGTDPGVNFGVIGATLMFNGAGQTAFLGVLSGAGVTFANDRSIWSEGGGSGLALVARAGSQAPGTDSQHISLCGWGWAWRRWRRAWGGFCQGSAGVVTRL